MREQIPSSGSWRSKHRVRRKSEEKSEQSEKKMRNFIQILLSRHTSQIIIKMKTIEEKKYQFASSIRRKQHQKLFQITRKWQEGSLNALAFLPFLLEDKMYQEISQVLDEMTLNVEEDECPPQIRESVITQYKHHDSEQVRMLMFKLMNRMYLWDGDHFLKALKMYSGGYEEMIKEVSIFLNREKKINMNTWRERVGKTLQHVILIPPKKQQLRFYWLDSLCIALEEEVCLEEESKPHFIIMFHMGVQISNEFDICRIIRITNNLMSDMSLAECIVDTDCFSKFLCLLKNCEIDLLAEGLQMIAQMLSTSEQIIHKLISKFGILSTLGEYVDHVLADIKVKCLWAISNLTGSQSWYEVTKNEKIMENLFKLVQSSTTHQIVLQQVYFCFLNLYCSADQSGISKIISQQHGVEILAKIGRETLNRSARPHYIERFMFAVYSFATKCPMSIPHLESASIRRIILEIEEGEKEGSVLPMIHQTLGVFDQGCQ